MFHVGKYSARVREICDENYIKNISIKKYWKAFNQWPREQSHTSLPGFDECLLVDFFFSVVSLSPTN